jgi:ribose transport system ATP-binding protein
MTSGGPRLVARDVRKAFGPTVALGGVSFSVEAGQVHALIGENGAGKSTLMNVLAGAIGPDAGELLLDGAPYRPSSPLDARRRGVAMVHQELSLCPHLTIAENIALGAEPSRFGIVCLAETRRIAESALARVADLSKRDLPLDAIVGDLSPAAQQLVEIARALSQSSCRVLILDEPTSSLAAADVDRLFSIVRALRDQGLAVIYISHFLEEVQRIADAFTVLRDGHTVGSGAMAGARIGDIVGMMAGRAVTSLFPRSDRKPGEVVLEVTDLAGVEKPSRASLSLRRGEVLGIAGLVGAGRTELARAIFGLDRVKSGVVKVLGVVGPSSPGARLERGMDFLSEDRKGEGLATALSIADNLTMSKLRGMGPFGLVVPSRQREVSRRWIERLGIRANDAEQPVGELSGGNQQKVALARLLYHDADVFLLDEPTRGIDVASKAQIYELIDKLASSGKAILVISSYLPELFGICDSIAVMRRGQLGEARPVRDLTEHGVLMEATGS